MLTLVRCNDQLRRSRSGLWHTLGDDPQIRIDHIAGGPAFVVIEMEAIEGELSPAIYMRREGRFEESSRADMGDGLRALVIVNMRDPVTLGGVRVDPTDLEGCQLRLRIWRRRTRAGLQRLIRRRIGANPGIVPRLVGADPGLAGHGLAISLPMPGRGVFRARLDAIWALAALEAARDPLPPVEEVEISFLVPVHDTPAAFLDTLLASFRHQAPGGELVLSDDGSGRPETLAWLDRHRDTPGLRVVGGGGNRGIAAATNAALAVATGHWVGLVDHDDALAPHAVDRLRRALGGHADLQFLYTDEVITNEAMEPVGLFSKPAFDPVLLSGMNFVNHLSLYRRDRLRAMGGLREGFHGSQDYELVLRYCRGLTATQVAHLPYPAYLWRQRADSVSHSHLDRATEAARRALGEHIGAVLPDALVEAAPLLPNLHRVRHIPTPRATVSAVIPSRDSPALIGALLSDLETKTTRPPDETIVVDNGSTDPATLALYVARDRQRGFRADMRPEPFNFARMANRGVALARGDAILLLNNDLSVLHPDWLEEMLECLAWPGTGVVGARLLFPDRTIQHAGVILGLAGLAGHWFYKARETETGPMGRLAVRNGMTVVTAACMLVSRTCWDAVGGMDETRFAVAYNDVDFCARARAAGFGVVWTPFATLLHHESATRGADLVGAKAERFRREKQALADRHGTAHFDDPAFSPWWTRHRSRPGLQIRDTLPAARHFHGMQAWPPAVPDADQAMRWSSTDAQISAPIAQSVSSDRKPIAEKAQRSG